MVSVLVGCPAEDAEEDTLTDTFGPATSTGASNASMSTSGPGSTTDEPGSSGGTTTAASGSTATGPQDPCGPGRACLGPPPLGWMGPIAVAKAATPEELPTCGDPFPGNDITRYEGYADPGPAQCECECGINPGVCNMTITEYSGDACSTFVDSTTATEGCFQYSQPSGSMRVYATSNGTAACDQQATETIPEIPWAAIVKGCSGGPSDESCDETDRICYGRPTEGFEQEICYIQEGDVECPLDTDYTEKTLRYSSFEDTRSCSDCQCGGITYCLEAIDYYSTADCSGSPAGTTASGECEGPVSNVAAVNFDYSEASCPVLSEATPEGDVMPLDPWTYCCAVL